MYNKTAMVTVHISNRLKENRMAKRTTCYRCGAEVYAVGTKCPKCGAKFISEEEFRRETEEKVRLEQERKQREAEEKARLELIEAEEKTRLELIEAEEEKIQKSVVYQLTGARGRRMRVFEDRCEIATDVTVGSLITGNAADGEKLFFMQIVLEYSLRLAGP